MSGLPLSRMGTGMRRYREPARSEAAHGLLAAGPCPSLKRGPPSGAAGSVSNARRWGKSASSLSLNFSLRVDDGAGTASQKRREG